MAVGEGLGNLLARVGLDTSSLPGSAAKAKAELAGVGGAATKVGTDVKSAGSILKGGLDDAAKSAASLGVGTGALSGHMSTLKSAVTDARSAFTAASGEGNMLKSVLTGVGVGVAGIAVAVGGAALAGISKFLSAAGQVRSVQATLGSTAEEASKLRNEAIGLGIDVDTMSKALFKLGPILEKNKGDLAGVHVEIAKNADGSSNMIATLDNMRTAYQGLTDPIQKAQFLQEAFKKTGIDLRPILSANADVLARMANTGPIFKQADLDKAKELSIAQRELKQRVDDLEISLAEKLAPALDRVAQMTDKNIDRGNFFKNVGLDVTRMVTGQWSEVGKLDSAHQKLADAQTKSKGSAEAAKDAQQQLTSQIEAQTKAMEQLTTAQEDAIDKDLAMDHALLAATRSAEGIKDAELQLAQAHQTVSEKQAKLNELQASGTASAVEIKGATLDLQSAQLAEQKAAEGVTDAHNDQRDALIAAAKAVTDKKVADEAATGATLTAEAKARIYIQALRDQAATLAPGSELRANLNGYADKLENGIPKLVETGIQVNGLQVANDGLDGLRAKLNALDGKTATVYTNNVSVYHDDISHSDAAPSGSAVGNVLGRRNVVGLAAGGTRTAGFITSGPRFLVGEGNPAYREAVIATDPQYRTRNIAIWKWAGREMGQFAEGGTTGSSSIGGGTIDYDRLAAAVVAASPTVHTVVTLDKRVLVEQVTQGQMESARARSRV